MSSVLGALTSYSEHPRYSAVDRTLKRDVGGTPSRGGAACFGKGFFLRVGGCRGPFNRNIMVRLSHRDAVHSLWARLADADPGIVNFLISIGASTFLFWLIFASCRILLFVGECGSLERRERASSLYRESDLGAYLNWAGIGIRYGARDPWSRPGLVYYRTDFFSARNCTCVCGEDWLMRQVNENPSAGLSERIGHGGQPRAI